MKTIDLLNDFQEVRECDFKGEHYSVRDNGAVYRHARLGKKVRKDDNRWTFGTPNSKNGYMYIGGIVRIHQIVATAFFGERDTKVYVVDHKDTNRRNNRVENLHWLTRLENILANPITRKKIIMCCGSIEAFLMNPSMIRKFANQNPDYSWMKAPTKEEAQRTLDNMNEWAFRPIEEPKGGKMGDWIYKSLGFNPQVEIMNELTKQLGLKKSFQVGREQEGNYRITVAKSPGTALQKDWITPTDFLLCPTMISDTPMQDYYKRLSQGALFTQNIYGGTTIVDFAIDDDGLYIWVLGKRTEKDPIKPWTLVGISVENGKFVHENLHSFFEEKGGLKYFTLAQGKEWTGGDCQDDYC
jgi:hypothetical protein